jgi:hypothetical protein
MFMVTENSLAEQDNPLQAIAPAYSKAIACFGHNRAATRGEVKDANAHPFQEGHITLIHNGTLNTWHNLCGHDSGITVDSHAIAYALSKRSWQEVLPEINGAFALAWSDAKENKVYITTNGERPIWYAHDDQGTIFFCSEYLFLNSALGRNNLKLKENDKGNSFFYVEKNTVLEFDLNKVGEDKFTFVEHKFEKKSFTQAATPHHTSQQHNKATADTLIKGKRYKSSKKEKETTRFGFRITNVDYRTKGIMYIGEVLFPLAYNGDDMRFFQPYGDKSDEYYVIGDTCEGICEGKHEVYNTSNDVSFIWHIKQGSVIPLEESEPDNKLNKKLLTDVNGIPFSKDDLNSWGSLHCDYCTSSIDEYDIQDSYFELTITTPRKPYVTLCKRCTHLYASI